MESRWKRQKCKTFYISILQNSLLSWREFLNVLFCFFCVQVFDVFRICLHCTKLQEKGSPNCCLPVLGQEMKNGWRNQSPAAANGLGRRLNPSAAVVWWDSCPPLRLGVTAGGSGWRRLRAWRRRFPATFIRTQRTAMVPNEQGAASLWNFKKKSRVEGIEKHTYFKYSLSPIL